MPVRKSRLDDACAPSRDDSFISEFAWPGAGAFFTSPETQRLELDVLALVERLRELRRLRAALDNWLRAERQWLEAAGDLVEAAPESAAVVTEAVVPDQSGHHRRRRPRAHRPAPDGQ
jgi:hypothetical protein